MTPRFRQRTDRANPARAGSETPLVLLVDDYEDNRKMYVQFFAREGLRVAEAATGGEALALAFALRPQVIVMDLALPGMDGWEATRQLKSDERTRRIPIVALTGHALADHTKSAMAAGCDAFLTKPCLPEQLFLEVHRILDGGRPTATPKRRRRRP